MESRNQMDAEPLGYAPPVTGRAIRIRYPLLLVIGIGASLVIAAVVAAPALRHPHPMSDRAHCAGNMRSIGTGLMMYANDHHGRPTL